jgi:hypothetical protein
MLCHCSTASAAASRTYTGMEPIGLPITISPITPGQYPGPPPAEPVGRWFSHPAATRCALGAAVGERGCTWQRAPLSHSIYWSELIAAGFNVSAFNQTVPNAHQPAAQTRANVAVFKAVWAAKRLAPCGAPQQSAFYSGVSSVTSLL